MCDGTRYDKTDDLVEWDVFRTEVLESQGWKLLRLFSPNVFRDLEAVLTQINSEHENCVQLEVMERTASSGGRVH
jgi:very-short-patch-repair endonuclease